VKKYHQRCEYVTKKNLDLLLESTPNSRRREDLTNDMRSTIAHKAYLAQINKSYGVITALANEYKISRQFIYNLLYTLQIALILSFAVSKETIAKNRRKSTEIILSLRFEGKCSIGAIATIMKRLDLPYCSESYISQTLKEIGGLLPQAQKIELDGEFEAHGVADEIFAKSKPILITGEPKSTLILGITLAEDRTNETWSKQFKSILKANPKLKMTGMTTDEGGGLCSAIEKTFPFITRQPDTYHGVAHIFGLLRSRFEKKVEMAITKERERDRVCMGRKTDELFEKKYELYEFALQETIQAVEEYEDFTYLYMCIIKQLQPFYSDGEIRDREKAEQEITVALDLMEELGKESINKDAQTVRGLFPELLNYFKQTKKSVKKCQKTGVEESTLKVLYLAWQWDKSVIKSRKKSRRDRAKWERDFYLEYAQDLIGEEFDKIKETVFKELDNIIQASSAIENINSVLRFYLDNSRSQTTQEFLNIFMFYHNHRRYKAGKRKGKTPMEIFTGKKQEKDWIELLLDAVEKKKPDFFL
jgi:hypothetical protein